MVVVWREAARLGKYLLFDEGMDTYLMMLKSRPRPIMPTADRLQVADVRTDGEEEARRKKDTFAMEMGTCGERGH
jgi:hypothetical protein